jgi:hypothetical protein
VQKEIAMHLLTLNRIAFMALAILCAHAEAQTPGETLSGLHQQASEIPGFQGFSAARGEQFFNATHANDWSCSTCHTRNPANPGKHARTSKVIQPMAPAINAERFTDQAKIDKWFKRNCNDVVDRACTAQEKGDVLTYLMSLR